METEYLRSEIIKENCCLIDYSASSAFATHSPQSDNLPRRAAEDELTPGFED